jgi:hypothetical protein
MASEMSNLSFASAGNEKPRETSRAAQESLLGTKRRLSKGVNRRPAISPTAMRWASARYFALDDTGESKWTK